MLKELLGGGGCGFKYPSASRAQRTLIALLPLAIRVRHPNAHPTPIRTTNIYYGYGSTKKRATELKRGYFVGN